MAQPQTEKKKGFYARLSARYPGLIEKIQRLIEDSEKSYAGNIPEADGSFLWEHTVHVASLAFKLAEAEHRDPLLTSLAALFHDAGKFAGGVYHDGDEAEEEEAARRAEALLKKSRVPAAERTRVAEAIRALYREGARPDPLADIVHDADFLSKFGYLGVAQFFIKSALRGRTLRAAVMSSLSKELTYAACLPLNMRTEAGRVLAVRKSVDTLKFHESLLAELRDVHGLEFRVKRVRVSRAHPGRGNVDVRLVLAPRCEACGGKWEIRTETSRGTKCEKLEARVRCAGCGEAYEIAFCLPELRG